MKTKSKEIKIAVATIISALLLYFGINYLKGVNLMKPANYYYTDFKDVTGVTVSTPVMLDGFKIGLVNDMEYNYGKPGNITVELSLDKKLRIPKGSYTTMELSLLGEASVVLHLNKESRDMLNIGDTINGKKTVGMMDNIAVNVMPQLEVLLPRIDTILTGLQAILANPAIHQSLSQINMTTANLETASRQLAVLMNKDIPTITGNLVTASNDFTQVSSNLKGIDLQSTMSSMDQSVKNMESFSKNLNNPGGTLGLLMNDRLLYDNLSNTANNADSLMIDLKKNPKRYVHFSIW